MRVSFKEARAQRYERNKEWHPYFAWRPLRAKCGTWVWLETVERKRSYGRADFSHFSWWSYRLPGSDLDD